MALCDVEDNKIYQEREEERTGVEGTGRGGGREEREGRDNKGCAQVSQVCSSWWERHFM